MALSTEQQILIEQRVSNEAKSTGAAYLMWLFLGGLGGHRFYLGRTGTAITQLVLCILGWATVAVGVGIALLAVLAIWVLIDAFMIPGMIQAHKEQVRQGLTSNALIMSAR